MKIAQLQAVETLEGFCRIYSFRSGTFLQDAIKYRTDLKVFEKNIERSQSKYYKMCSKREKSEKEIEKAIQEHEKGALTFAQVQKKSNTAFDVKKNTEISYHEYVNDLNAYNKMIEDSQVLYKDSLNKLQDLDEQRVTTIKTTLEQFFNTFIDTGTILSQKFEESVSSVQLLNPQTDVKIFIDENRSSKEFLKKKEFVSYDYSKKIMQNRQERLLSEESNEDLIDFGRRQSVESNNSRASSKPSIDEPAQLESRNSCDLLGLNEYEELKEDKQETDTFDENKKFVYNTIDGFFKGEQISGEDQLRVFELLHENYIGVVVANYLHTIKSPRKLANVNILKSLSEIIKYLITVSIHDKQNDFEVVHAVLGCSQFIYAFDEKTMRKILLTHSIREHGIWQDISKWILWIYKVIENKRQDYQAKKMSTHRSVTEEDHSSPQKKSTGQWIKGLTKYFAGKSPSTDDIMISDDVTKNLIFNVLSQFIYHFANFGVSLEGGKKLILYFSEKYSLDKSRIHTVLTEFEAIQRRGGHILNAKEKMLIPILKRNERLKKYGHDEKTMVMGLVIPYIGDDVT